MRLHLLSLLDLAESGVVRCVEFMMEYVDSASWMDFYTWSPNVEPWVNRWTFSPPSSPSPSHHQLFVSLRYRKHQFSNWFDFPGNSSYPYLPPPPPFAVGEAHAMPSCSHSHTQHLFNLSHICLNDLFKVCLIPLNKN